MLVNIDREIIELIYFQKHKPNYICKFFTIEFVLRFVLSLFDFMIGFVYFMIVLELVLLHKSQYKFNDKKFKFIHLKKYKL